MKKIDLHVHTIATVSDSAFTFSMDKLKEYVEERSIDCIAITNHNVFDKEQYDLIRNELDILVLPGIEVNLEKGHIILITEENDIEDFSLKCDQVKNKIKLATDYLTIAEFVSIFSDREKYLVIPHYKKDPYIRQEIIEKVGNIFCGEVKNQRQFSICSKDSNSLNPVLFSDIRIKDDLDDFPIRQTFINTNDVTFASIVYSLRDKNKLSLTADGKEDLFEIMPNGFVASTGLNVILGNRSSGKTVTLDNIFKYNSNVKYIKQFALIEKDEKKEEQLFTDKIKTNKSDLIEFHLSELKNVISDISKIDLNKDNADFSNYIESWINYANDYDKRDSFSKSKIYSDNTLDIKNIDEADKIIKAILTLLSSVEYKDVIGKYIEEDKLIYLLRDMISILKSKQLENRVIKETNRVINEIKNLLNQQTSVHQPKSFDLRKYYLNRKKVDKFNELVRELKKERKILEEEIYKFKIVAKTRPFANATELRTTLKFKPSLASTFAIYNENGYDYLKALIGAGIEYTDLYKAFVNFEYNIQNEYELNVSGGERSEFRLLDELSNSSYYDLVLIDEPESSFDNIFLHKNINSTIKEISKERPVFLVTHNNTVGGSIKPDYILYTEREIKNGNAEFSLYGGYPTQKKLISIDGAEIDNYSCIVDSLEGGEDAYNERKKDYEILKNK